ncbi:ribosome-binding factor A [Candidatus Kinetoplastibacterium desouzaii TCC079E]|uniref:Ribosome-binding factor A n=1 Tax=Candidatus Kinetoplastidibacterium desouzai TCC079E TaxID=1208919 RepID=M1LS38_9PROT|nr:30S ribosome-binding factor RbfA [Candidatus Kinetoplastibacterium desouzaii]AGF46961.1 ribosome-binding factor A [Candidatus Kinetoplastibacterium desouzaii TCC079E]
MKINTKGEVSARNIRISRQIQKDLSRIITQSFSIENIGILTISKVNLSVDYAHAKVYFTVFGADPDTVELFLNNKSGWLYSCLYKLLKIHTVPTLHFLYDKHIEKANNLLKLIEKANDSSI